MREATDHLKTALIEKNPNILAMDAVDPGGCTHLFFPFFVEDSHQVLRANGYRFIHDLGIMEYVHAKDEPDFDELCKIVGEIAAEYGMIRVYLFGSRARGDNGPDSDYDFCIVAPKEMTLFKIGGFYGKLEDALGAEVDIVSEKAMSREFGNEVMRYRRLLYEARYRKSESRRRKLNSIESDMDRLGNDIEDSVSDESYQRSTAKSRFSVGHE